MAAASTSSGVPALASNHTYRPSGSPLNHVNCRFANARVARCVSSKNSMSSSCEHAESTGAFARLARNSIAWRYPMERAAGLPPGAIPASSIPAASSSMPSRVIASTRASTRRYNATRGRVRITQRKSNAGGATGAKLPTGRPDAVTISNARSTRYQSFSAIFDADSASPASERSRVAARQPGGASGDFRVGTGDGSGGTRLDFGVGDGGGDGGARGGGGGGVGRGRGGFALDEPTEVHARAADDDGGLAPSDDILHDGPRSIAEFSGAELEGRVQKIEHVVGYARSLRLGELGRAHVQAGEHLDAVGGDDLAVERGGEAQAQRRLAHRGRSRDHEHLREGRV